MTETSHEREVRLRDLHILASQELRKYEEGSQRWMYWRGVLLGLEAATSPMVRPDWAIKVGELAAPLAGR